MTRNWFYDEEELYIHTFFRSDIPAVMRVQIR